MDFDFNDPLGDILSDDSDDSFFKNDKFTPKSKKSPKTDVQVKKSNLFDLEPDTAKKTDEPTPVVQPKSARDWLGLTESKPSTPKIEPSVKTDEKLIRARTIIKPISKLTEKDDLLDQLDALDDKKATNKPNRSEFSLDDLLGKPPSQKTEESAVKRDNIYTPSISTAPISRIERIQPIVKETRNPGFQGDQKPEKKDVVAPRRPKPKSDWLGLLGDETDEIFDDNGSKKQTLSELLSGKDKTVSKTEEKISRVTEQTIKPVNVEKKITMEEELENLISKPLLMPNIDENMFKMPSDVDVEQNSASLCLQQQEAHLKVALQLKAQEERLAAMHEKQSETRRIQKEVVTAHKEHLNNILQGQADHRAQLQGIIKQHQQRINKHIETLLRPQSNNDDSTIDDRPPKFHEKSHHEKEHLENIITILKENHSREIEIIDSSYGRQLAIVNDSLSALEERFRNENEKLHTYYNDRIDKLEGENLKLDEHLQTTVKNLTEKYSAEKDKMEDQHLNDIETLRKQYEAIINNIKESYIQERLTVNETKDYSTKFNRILVDVERNNDACSRLMEKIENFTSNDVNIQQRSLQNKEEQINRILDHVDQQKTMYEDQYRKSQNILTIVEERLKFATQNLEEEKSALKQKQYTFECEQERSKREFELMISQFETEKSIFKKSCDNVERGRSEEKLNLDEQIKKIENDRAILAEENKKISSIRAECQSLKNRLNDELADVNEKKRLLQIENDRIYQEEMKILQKSRDLEILSRSIAAKQKIADNKVSEADFAQRQYEDKLSRIQEYLLSLNTREQQIAKDKISLSRERLLVYNERIKNDRTVCDLCRSSFWTDKIKNNIHPNLPDMDLYSNLNKDVPNMDILNNGCFNFNLGDKDMKDDINMLEQINNLGCAEGLHTSKDYIENLPNIYQDIVDPKIRYK